MIYKVLQLHILDFCLYIDYHLYIVFKNVCPECFKALSVPVRAKIYSFIAKSHEMSVMGIVKRFNLTQPTISYHLKGMEKAGLLKSRKEGRQVVYSIRETCPHDNKKCIVGL